MNMEAYIRALETYAASRKLNLGDGESIWEQRRVIAVGSSRGIRKNSRN